MVLRPIAPLPKVVPGEGKDMRIGFCAIWLAPYCWAVLGTSTGAQTAASSDAESMRISSWCTPLGGLGNTGRAIHLVHKRNKKTRESYAERGQRTIREFCVFCRGMSR